MGNRRRNKKDCKKIQSKKIAPEEISEEILTSELTTNNIPDPELLIRTSGEHRVSNFLLWQIAYSELYFSDILWPDFRKKFTRSDFRLSKRERRFGKTSEQIEGEEMHKTILIIAFLFGSTYLSKSSSYIKQKS